MNCDRPGVDRADRRRVRSHWLLHPRKDILYEHMAYGTDADDAVRKFDTGPYIRINERELRNK